MDLLRARVRERLVEVRPDLRLASGRLVRMAAPAGRLRNRGEDLGARLGIAFRGGRRLLLLLLDRTLYGLRGGRDCLAAAAARREEEGEDDQRE